MDPSLVILSNVFIVCLLAYWIISSAVRSANKAKPPPSAQPPTTHFPPHLIAPSATPDGPGRFRVDGVERASRMDTSGFYEASSSANARVKAELDGVVVTHVERL